MYAITCAKTFIKMYSLMKRFALQEYDQNGDQPPQYFPQQNHPMFEKLLEDRAKWREPDAVRQPKVDVKVELAKLNFCKLQLILTILL